MPLSHHDQLTLLQDILTNHLEDCCGSVAECEQMERLVKSLLVNENIHTNMSPVLENIYTYSQSGKNSADLDSHINAHQAEITQWVSDISLN